MIPSRELDRIIAEAIEKADIPAEPAELYDPIKYMLSIGGKRLRPKLCLLTYNLFKEDIGPEIIVPSIGLEVFHEFTLIHDDIMDRSDIRRGMPTVYRKWNENIAILSGDVMSILAYRFMAKAPADKLAEVLDLFTTTAAMVCEGQQYDMNFESKDNVTAGEYMMMTGLKTAVLIACSAKTGALIAGADKKACDAIYDYAYRIGLAFQIMDDYLDSFGDVSVFGKKIGKDILCNKKTWLLIKAMEKADSSTEREIRKIMSMKGDTAEEASMKIRLMLDIYRKLEIDRAALAEAERLNREATETLLQSGLDSTQLSVLTEFGDLLTKRNK